MNLLYREMPEGVAGIVPAGTLDILAGYADDLDTHNGDVTGHSRRVAGLAVDIARELGFEELDLAAIWLYGRFHDIGKLMIPAEILGSKGALTVEQRALVDKHGDHGGAILSMIPSVPQDMIDVARFHHERYDGHGYNRLKGDDIPVLGRLMQVADVFDAMVSDRSYKKGHPVDFTLMQMTADGPEGEFGRTMFDPLILRTLVGIQIARQGGTMDTAWVADLQGFVRSVPEPDSDPMLEGNRPQP